MWQHGVEHAEPHLMGMVPITLRVELGAIREDATPIEPPRTRHTELGPDPPEVRSVSGTK